MSYCRWSSDDFMCDLYCYEDVGGGWTTHVAGTRLSRRPLTPAPMGEDGLRLAREGRYDEWATMHRARSAEIETTPHEAIGLPFDGRTFNDATLEEFRERVVMLRDAGYSVPDYVVEEIDAEIKAETAAA